MPVDDLHDVLVEQMRDVHKVFPSLILEKGEGGQFTIHGTLGFRMEKDGKEVEDSYQLTVTIPPDYPRTVPTVKETGERIPEAFHTYPGDHTLCLGAPLAVAMTFAQHRTLLGYLRDQVVPHLFSHSYKQRYGAMPHGELAHGGEGIFQYYSQLFGVDQAMMVLGFLRILAEDDYKGHKPCPCNSGQKLRECHGPQLLAIKPCLSKDGFMADYLSILKHVKGDHSILDYRGVLPRVITDRLRKRRKK